MEVTVQDAAEGFGKIYPSAPVPRHEEEREEDEDIPSEFISRRELERGRLSRDGETLTQIVHAYTLVLCSTLNIK